MSIECAAGRKAGTNAGYRTGCRCENCTTGARRYEKIRKQKKQAGWVPFVDAQPVRDHVNALRAAGMGVFRIVEKSGVAYTVVQRLTWSIQGSAPTVKIRPQNAAALLAVTFDPYDGAMIDATGSKRRIEALMCIGWSQRQIERRLGWGEHRLSEVRSNDRITAAKARDIAAVYDVLWTVEPPRQESWEKGSVARTRKLAATLGFSPALAWSDDTIDDPAAQPAGVKQASNGAINDSIDEIAVERRIAGDRVHLTYHETRFAVQLLHGMGCTATTIATRLRISGASVNRYIDARETAA